MRRSLVAVLVLTSLACTKTPPPDPQPVPWTRYNFREVTSLRGLPMEVQQALGVEKPGTEGIADRGGNYNKTDVILHDYPMRRFAVAGVDGGTTLVAAEHGGFGWGVDVDLYVVKNGQATIQESWGLIEAPKTLADLLSKLPPSPQPVK